MGCRHIYRNVTHGVIFLFTCKHIELILLLRVESLMIYYFKYSKIQLRKYENEISLPA